MTKEFTVETPIGDYALNYMVSFLRGKIATHTVEDKSGRAFMEFLSSLYYDYRPYAILAKDGFDFKKITKDNEEILDFLVDAGLHLNMTFGDEYLLEISHKYVAGLKKIFCSANKGIVGEENTKLFSSEDTLKKISNQISQSSIIAFIIVLQYIPADIFNGILAYADLKPLPPGKGD